VLLHASKRIDTFRGDKGKEMWHQLWYDRPRFNEHQYGGDRSSESIALATGKAENEIPAEDLEAITVSEFLGTLKAGPLDVLSVAGAAGIPDEERVAVLLDLLTGLDASREQLGALNQFLEEQGSPIRLSGRKSRGGAETG
jgi:hypothetical protein